MAFGDAGPRRRPWRAHKSSQPAGPTAFRCRFSHAPDKRALCPGASSRPPDTAGLPAPLVGPKSQAAPNQLKGAFLAQKRHRAWSRASPSSADRANALPSSALCWLSELNLFLSAGEGALAQNPPINDDVSRPHAKSPLQSSSKHRPRGRNGSAASGPKWVQSVGAAGHPSGPQGAGWCSEGCLGRGAPRGTRRAGTGCWVLKRSRGAGCWVLKQRLGWGAGTWSRQGAGRWVLNQTSGAGCWVLKQYAGTGCWVLGQCAGCLS